MRREASESECTVIDKRVTGADEEAAADAALASIQSGMTVMVGGFGLPGQPVELLEALMRSGVDELTIIANNAGTGDEGLAALIAAGRVRKVICSYPRQKSAWHFGEKYRAGEIELELVPQGTLSERIRAGGAGIGAFYVRTGYGTKLAEGKQTMLIDGHGHVLEYALKAHFALVRAHTGDRWGNITYRGSGLNFAPPMCAASSTAIVQVEHLVELGQIDPGRVDTPGIHVDGVIHVPNPKYVDKE